MYLGILLLTVGPSHYSCWGTDKSHMHTMQKHTTEITAVAGQVQDRWTLSTLRIERALYKTNFTVASSDAQPPEYSRPLRDGLIKLLYP